MDDYQKAALAQGLEDSRRMGGDDALVEAYYAARDDGDASPDVVEWIRQYTLNRISMHMEQGRLRE